MGALRRSSIGTRAATIRAALALALLALLPAGCRRAAPQEPVFEVVRIARGMYELSFDAGGYPDKVIASVGPDGLLIVDSAERRTAKALAQALGRFGKGPPKIVINTHSHIEHMGGNAEVGRGATIVAHRNVLERYRNGLYFFGDFPPEGLPNRTFTDSLTLRFNGEDVRLVAFPGAHDDSDVLVWFPREKVAVAGALCMGEHFPSIDGDTGDILRYPEVARRALAWLPEDALIVPAHARDCRMAEARLFLDMLEKTGAVVREGRAAGKDLARLKAEDVLAAWRSFESSYVKRDDWLTSWYEAYETPRSGRPKPFAPVVRAFRDSGAVAAVDTYSRLRRTSADQYWFEDQALMWMGRRLARLRRDPEAIVFLDRCIAEWPGSEGAAVSHEVLSTVYERMGDSARAATHLGAYLEKHPEDGAAQRRLAADRAASGNTR